MYPNYIKKTVSLCFFFHLRAHRFIFYLIVTYWYNNCTAEDDVATIKDSSSPPKYTGTGHVASQYPSDPRSPFPEQPSYVVYVPGQPISAWSPNNATLPGHQSPPSEVGIHEYQTLLNYPQQLFYQGTCVRGGFLVALVSVLLIMF